ncbi:hypothetical protein K4K59_004187 [Colletotrichum sp. SAR11_240]|nr:hypothetical protein K4K59_004187 [Colletotrichum sp. SAR11_240]
MYRLYSRVKPPHQDEPQAQVVHNPSEDPLPPISDKPDWHPSPVRNTRLFRRFFRDPAKSDAGNLVKPVYWDFREDGVSWPVSLEKDDAPLERLLTNHSYEEALSLCSIDPSPARDEPIVRIYNGFSKAATIGPEAEDTDYNDTTGRYGSGSARIPADQVLPAPRPMQVDRQPAALNLDTRNNEVDKEDAQYEQFGSWWKALSPEQRRAILEESRQAKQTGYASQSRRRR